MDTIDGMPLYPIPEADGYFVTPEGRVYGTRGRGWSRSGNGYMARQRVNCDYIYIGSYPTEEEAAEAVREWRVRHGMHPICREMSAARGGGADGRYWAVGLKYRGRQRRVTVHRLVALAMIPNPDGLPEVRHRDDDPDNNHVSNLAWGTRADNFTDMHYNRAQSRA